MFAPLVLLAALAQDRAPDSPPPRLAAPLAWLVPGALDQRDAPHGRLELLDVGAERPRTLLSSAEHTGERRPIDRHWGLFDPTVVAWSGDEVLVRRCLGAPGVPSLVEFVDVRGGSVRELSVRGHRFTPSPDGAFLLAGAQLVPLAGGEPRPVDLGPLVRKQGWRGTCWAPDGASVLVLVGEDREERKSSLWSVPIDGAAPLRLGRSLGLGPGASLHSDRAVDGRLLITSTLVAPALSSWPQESRNLYWLDLAMPEALHHVTQDLLYCGVAALRPGTGEIAYLRGGDGALVLASPQGRESPRVLLQGSRAELGKLGCVTSLAWSPDGTWLAFGTDYVLYAGNHSSEDSQGTDPAGRDAVASPPRVGVVDVEHGRIHDLGPGRQPAWGPVAR